VAFISISDTENCVGPRTGD